MPHEKKEKTLEMDYCQGGNKEWVNRQLRFYRLKMEFSRINA